MATCTLGKMVQPSAVEGYISAPYLRAAHIQRNGRVIELPDQGMWFSPAELNALTLRRGDVVVVEGGAGYGRSAVLSHDLEGWGFQNSIVRVRPNHSRADGRFIDYAIQAALLSGEIESSVSTATIPHFTAEKVARLEIAELDVSYQRRIADFLDRETAQIDAFIAKNEELIALLTERRATVLRTATTVGIRSGEVLVDSSVEQVGRIPEHWRMLRLSLLFGSTGSGTTPAPEQILDAEDADIPWVTTGELREAQITATLRGVSAETLASTPALRLHPAGSLLIAMYGATIGRTAILRTAAASNQAVCALSRPAGCDVQYVEYALQASRERLMLDAVGGGQPNINQETVRAFRIPVPPLEEQRAIATYVAEQTAHIDEAISTARRAIELARERRAALISAAVTGKIDVGVSA